MLCCVMLRVARACRAYRARRACAGHAFIILVIVVDIQAPLPVAGMNWSYDPSHIVR